MTRYYLSQKQETFVREYIKTDNTRIAYLRAYGGTDKNANMNSWRLMKKPYIQERYNQLLRRHMKRSDISVEKILGDYQDALDMAKGQEKPGEIVAAATAQAKLVGLMRDRVETGEVGDFDNMKEVSEVLEAVSQELGASSALALAKAFKLDEPKPQTEEEIDNSILSEAKPASDAVN